MFIFQVAYAIVSTLLNSAISSASACRLIFPTRNPVDFTVTNKVQAAFLSELLEYIQKHAVVFIANRMGIYATRFQAAFRYQTRGQQVPTLPC